MFTKSDLCVMAVPILALIVAITCTIWQGSTTSASCINRTVVVDYGSSKVYINNIKVIHNHSNYLEVVTNNGRYMIFSGVVHVEQ